jgi:hypothetical protein
MHWASRYVFGSPAGELFALGIAILFSVAFCIALSNLVYWLRTREREADESEKEYWRIHR